MTGDRSKLVTSTPVIALSGAWRSFFEQTYEGPRRRDAVARLARMLLRRYVDPSAARFLCQYFNTLRCIAPLDPDEVQRVFDDIASHLEREEG